MTRDAALKLLQISNPNPLPEEVVKAYRAMARKYHPDLYATADDTVQDVMNEKFVTIGEAKSLLLQQAGQGAGMAYGNPHFEGQLVGLETCIERRQFRQALEHVEHMLRQYGDSSVLYEAKFRIHDEMEQFKEAYDALCKAEALNPAVKSDADFQHVKAMAAGKAQCFGDAHRAIERAISLLSSPTPAVLATKAYIYIMEGKAAMADGVVDQLRELDPAHPLVKERDKVFRVGETYVDKREATSNACLLCALLECLFDCI